MTVFSDVVTEPSQLMGCKAVFGRVSSHVLCFGSRGDGSSQDQFYMMPAGVARRAVERRFAVAIGGGREVPRALEGRALELVEVGTVYGDTAALLSDPLEIRKLAQWPVAVILHNVWSLEGSPHIVAELGLPDRRILEGANDGIVRREPATSTLWHALSDRPITLVALPQSVNILDDGKPRLVTTAVTEKTEVGSDEGKRIWARQRSIERDRGLVKEAKHLNLQSYGAYTCEACLFSQTLPGMFDAHHPNPLATGIRTTLAEHLVILCPTCHRRAHIHDRLRPYTLLQLRHWNDCGRRDAAANSRASDTPEKAKS